MSRERLQGLVRRFIPVILVGAGVSGLVAFAVSSSIAPEYEASAQLYLAPPSNATIGMQDVILGQNLARTYVQLASAEVVLRPAMERIGRLSDLNVFRSRTRVEQVRETSVITISYTDVDRRIAAATANAITDSFITQARALQTSLQGTTNEQLEEQIRSVRDDITALDQQISALRARLATTPKPGESDPTRQAMQLELSQLDTSRQSKQQTLAQLLKTRDELRLAAARAEATVSLWQSATPPERPVSPRIGLNTALAALTGALLALLIAMFLAYVDDRLTDPDDVLIRLRTIPLGQVKLHDHPESLAGKLFVRDEPSSPESEAIRALRTNILFTGVDRRPRTILVTSAVPREGKSVLSANLALAFAEAGTPTTLVDADLRRPSQHRLFRTRASSGLTTLLTNGLSAEALQQFRVSSHLMVIPSGPLPPNPAEMLSSGRMSALLDQLAGLAENGVVIVDTSPVLPVADPAALSTKVDGCVLVVDSSSTRTAVALRAVEALQRVHANIFGAVLNKTSPSDGLGYHEYYGYSAPARGNSRGKIPQTGAN